MAAIYLGLEDQGRISLTTIANVTTTPENHQTSAVLANKKTSQTYYIDRIGGNNRHSGTRIDQAWKDFSILKKVSFAPGDKILLKRGEVWNQTLFTPSGGTEKESIIIDAYGQGALPVIDVLNHDPAAIRIYHSFISINNIRVQNSKNTCIAISVDGGFTNIKLNKLEIFNAGKNGIEVIKGGTKLEITHCYIENSDNNGIHLGGSAENKLSNVIVSGCHIKKVSHNDGITIHNDDTGNTAGSNFLFKNNIAEMCGEQGFDVTSGKNVLLLNNVSNNNGQGGILVEHTAQNVTINGHISTDEPVQQTSAAINLGGSGGNIRLLKSLIKGNGYHLLRINTNNVAVFNNTFIWDGGNSPIDITGKIENIHFVNNIVASNQPQMSRIRFLEASRPPDYHSFNFDYNIYYIPDNIVTIYYNKKNYPFKTYQTKFNVEINSQNINPEFIDTSRNEFHLKKNSPAIDKGCFYTLPVSQNTGKKTRINNALFFYKNPISDEHQCLMFKGINGLFYVQDVNYTNDTIFLDKPIETGLTNSVGGCYTQFSLDIGAYEFGDSPVSTPN